MNNPAIFAGRVTAVIFAGLVVVAGPAYPQAPAPVERVGQLIADARANFARVHDYTGTLVRQERIADKLQPEQFIDFKIRQQPYSVYLRWASPKHLAGQEAIYVDGKNNNEIRAKGTGVLAVAGYVSLRTNDPRVMRNSRHSITQTGIGNLLEILSRSYDVGRRLPPNQVTATFAQYAFERRPCTRMEVTHHVHAPELYCHRCVVYFDNETKLPVRAEVYDWPTRKENPNGDLLECYSYINLKFNVGLTDATFAEP